MPNKSFYTILENLIKHYRIAVLGALLIHTFFMLFLVVLEISKPTLNQEQLFSVELAPEITVPDQTETQNNDVQNKGDNDLTNVKNVSANEADKNKSFDDYYNEVQNIVNKSNSQEKFVANDYADQRNLIKDYSKDPDFANVTDNKSIKSDNQKNSDNKAKNTYAGNAIITYNLNGRKAVKLPVPAYQCIGSGVVVIEVIVNKMGVVKSANIISSNTTLNESCLAEAANRAAYMSKFEIDLKATDIQKGTINYKFIGQ